MSKIIVKRKGKALTKMELRHRYLPWKLLRFLKVFLNGVFQKLFSTDKQIFNISNKVTSIVFMLLWSYTEAATGRVLWEKVFLETAQKSHENTCARVSILIKIGLQPY